MEYVEIVTIAAAPAPVDPARRIIYCARRHRREYVAVCAAKCLKQCGRYYDEADQAGRSPGPDKGIAGRS